MKWNDLRNLENISFHTSFHVPSMDSDDLPEGVLEESLASLTSLETVLDYSVDDEDNVLFITVDNDVLLDDLPDESFTSISSLEFDVDENENNAAASNVIPNALLVNNIPLYMSMSTNDTSTPKARRVSKSNKIRESKIVPLLTTDKVFQFPVLYS